MRNWIHSRGRCAAEPLSATVLLHLPSEFTSTLLLGRGDPETMVWSTWHCHNGIGMVNKKRRLVASMSAVAKINLTLEVLGRRPDGFHDLRSLAVGVGLADELSCHLARDIELTCSDTALAGRANLAWQAMDEVAKEAGPDRGLSMHLVKRIPVAAGMGGGSSDAAAALQLADRLWETKLGRQRLAAIGLKLGSDIPLFFELPSVVMTGRGETVTPVSMAWQGHVLLISVDVPVPTPAVFARWKAADSSHTARGNDATIVKARCADTIMAQTVNDLEPAVFRVAPAVQDVRELVTQHGLGPVRVSGAGSVLYRLFNEREAACQVAGEIESLGLRVHTAVVDAPTTAGQIDIKEST